MLVVPSVEVDVECHDAARRHACDQRPETQQNHSMKLKSKCQQTNYELNNTLTLHYSHDVFLYIGGTNVSKCVH